MNSFENDVLSMQLIHWAEDGTKTSLETMTSLMESGADPTFRDPCTGLNARDTAVKHKHTHVLALLGGGTDLSWTTLHRLFDYIELNTDLIDAIDERSVGTCSKVRRCLEAGAHPYYVDAMPSRTAFDAARTNGNPHVLALLRGQPVPQALVEACWCRTVYLNSTNC